MTAYYNETEPYAAQWLRNLISAGLIPAGDVDERSICDVQPDDLRGYIQCHFFAGIAGWAYALRLAGWPDEREIWTGSCPCQPFSVAGKGAGQADDRHLWPDFFRLIDARRPAVVMGEQVAAAIGKDWLDGVFADLESVGYTCGSAVVPACSVNAPHRRDRLWFVADAEGGENRRIQQRGLSSDADANGGHDVADANGAGPQILQSQSRDACEECQAVIGNGRSGAMADANQFSASEERPERSGEQRGVGGDPWAYSERLVGTDGKIRRVKSGIRLLADGIPARVGRLRAYGNAIVPQVAAEIIATYMESV